MSTISINHPYRRLLYNPTTRFKCFVDGFFSAFPNGFSQRIFSARTYPGFGVGLDGLLQSNPHDGELNPCY